MFPSVDLEYGPLVWVLTSQTGDSEVRGAGYGEGVLTAGVTGYKVYGARECDVERREGWETVVVLTCAQQRWDAAAARAA